MSNRTYTEADGREAVDTAIAHKKRLIEASISLLREQLLGQLDAKAEKVKSEYEKTLETKQSPNKEPAVAEVHKNERSTCSSAAVVASNSGPISHADLIHLLVPFADFSNKLAVKIGNACLTRELMFDMCNQVVAHCSAHFSGSADGAERQRNAKSKFDLICNYSKRAADAIPNTGTFYDQDLCLYLMSKTFKKSACDAYDSMLSLEGMPEGGLQSSSWLIQHMKSNAELRLGSIGGGPGSDLTGMVSYFHDLISSSPPAEQKALREQVTFRLQVFDIMDQNWSAAASRVLAVGFEKHVGKVAVHEQDANNEKCLVQYQHIDLKEPSTLAPLLPDLQQLHFITICWALNEALFIEEFWLTLLANTGLAYIIIVEGTDEKLDKVVAVCADSRIGRAVRYDKFESPRRLIVKPKDQ